MNEESTRRGTELAVHACGLTKRFGRLPALDGLDLEVPRGVVYGLLGPNGAGKTTTIRVLATLLRPDAGRARVLGHDVVQDAVEVRRRVSLTAQFASVDEELTAAENLVLLARLRGISRRRARVRADELLTAFGLAAAAGRGVGQFSGGMRRRLDIAASIIVTPDLLFLDEPTTGLDPRSRNQLWEIVRSVVAQGTTVLLTTQYLDEADQLADRIAVVDRGKVIAEGTRGELKSSVGANQLRVRLHDPAQRERAAGSLAAALGVQTQRPVDPAEVAAQLPRAGSDDPGSVVLDALAELARSGIAVAGFSFGQPTLDEVFLALTGRPSDTEAPDEERVA